jgi:hypothetical protein
MLDKNEEKELNEYTQCDTPSGGSDVNDDSMTYVRGVTRDPMSNEFLQRAALRVAKPHGEESQQHLHCHTYIQHRYKYKYSTSKYLYNQPSE